MWGTATQKVQKTVKKLKKFAKNLPITIDDFILICYNITVIDYRYAEKEENDVRS
jgi:hypothetical protein